MSTALLLLDVPLRTVTKGSNLCQLAAALMVMQYYGDYVESSLAEAEILSFNPFTANKNERHSQGIAIWLKQRGYDVFYSHHDLQVLDKDTVNLTEKNLVILKDKLSTLEASENNSYRIKKIHSDIMVIESGCRYSSTLADLTLIDNFLSKNKPVMITVKNSALTATPDDRSNHTIVVIGKNKEGYIYNDNNMESAQTIDANHLLQAWYSAGAYLIVASKP